MKLTEYELLENRRKNALEQLDYCHRCIEDLQRDMSHHESWAKYHLQDLETIEEDMKRLEMQDGLGVSE